MTSFAPALTTALVEFLWQGAAVAAVLWILLALLRGRSAQARYLAAAAAMAGLALAPVVTFWRIYGRPVGVGLVFPGAASRVAAVVETTVARSAPAWLSSNWVLEVWAIGVLAFSIRLIRSAAQVHRMRRDGESADPAVVSTAGALARRMGVSRAVRVLVSTMADVPGVVGWLRPVILAPVSALAGLTPEQLETVLAHEIAHIRRHDYAINLFQVLVETLLFYHPAVWWVSTQVRKERELCCDDMVVETCGDALCDARALTTLERMRGAATGLALGSTDGALSLRVKRLVSEASAEQTAPPRLAAVTAMTLALLSIALSTNWMRVKAQSDALLVPSLDAGIEVDSNGAALIHRTHVEYPESLKQKMIGGIVTVEATLDDRGEVSDARVVSGPPELRKPALESVLNWHFMAAGNGATRMVTITFRPPEPGATARPTGIMTATQNQGVQEFLRDELVEAERQLANAQVEPAAARKPGEVEQLQERVASLQAKGEFVNAGTTLTALAEYQGKGFQFRLRVPDEPAALLQPRVSVYLPDAATPPAILRVEAGGLSGEVTKELLARLPARAGELLTPERLAAIRQAAEQFDEHFRVAVVPVPAQGDNVVVVRIDIER
jgi:TonB family protein